MRFWDSSALVPLLVPEEDTASCQRLLKEDGEVVVWSFTWTEILSSIYRKVRDKVLTESDLRVVLEDLEHFRKFWIEVLPHDEVRKRAHRLLASHPLRAADALQLAAALVSVEEAPQGQVFITRDERLARAARNEGFVVLPSF